MNSQSDSQLNEIRGKSGNRKQVRLLSSYKKAFMDTKSEIERLKAVAKLRKKKVFAASKLDKYKHELLRLDKEGATLELLQIYLQERKINVVLSTIHRWLKKNNG